MEIPQHWKLLLQHIPDKTDALFIAVKNNLDQCIITLVAAGAVVNSAAGVGGFTPLNFGDSKRVRSNHQVPHRRRSRCESHEPGRFYSTGLSG